MQPISKQVLARIYGNGRGWVFSPASFLDLDDQRTVAVVLSRLVSRGTIRRLSRGLYDYPKKHHRIGVLAPSPDAIAKALVSKAGIRLQASEAYAANLLGLTEQVPARIVFLTDGAAKNVKVGNQQISLRHTTTPLKLATAGRTSGLVIQALRYLGQRNVHDDTIHFLRRKLSNDDKKQLLKDIIYAMSTWPRCSSQHIRHLKKF
jgi:predicted GNAT family acetyltransferase